jgi:membrane protein implicated in regulation of membrane protease activity
MLVAIGAVALVVLVICVLLTRALLRMPAAAPPAADLVGALGTVVTKIPQDGTGEVAVTASGQRVKVDARADGPVDPGTTVVVIDLASPTEVVVAESGF